MRDLDLAVGTVWKAKDGRIVRFDGWSAASADAEATASCTVVSRLSKYMRKRTSFRRSSFGTFLEPAPATESGAP